MSNRRSLKRLLVFIIPVGAEHTYHAVTNSKPCRLAALG